MAFIRIISLVLLYTFAVSGYSIKTGNITESVQATFTNPILDEKAPDPSVLRHNGFYYLILALSNQITILKSPILTDFRNAERREVYGAPPGRANLWAPEMHYIRGNLYIYFTMDDGVADQNHRMYVIKADDPNNPLGSWGNEKRVVPNEELYAIDGTVMQYGNGQLYFIWTGNPETGPASMGLFIAPMVDPETVLVPRILIRRPKSEWEMHGFPVNEGPFIIENAGRTFLVFSGSSTFTPDYCLSIMVIDGLLDPLDPINWWTKDECLFARNDAEGVFGTGHATFAKSPDDTETWMIYHAVNDVTDLGINRYARVQKLEWNSDNSPRFPQAIGVGKPLQAPSGQN